MPLIPLDIATLMAMESFVALIAGLALLYGWWQSRDATALVPLAISSILASFGIYDIYTGLSSGNPLWLAAGNLVLTTSAALVFVAARVFSRRKPLIPLAAAGIVLTGVTGVVGGALGLPASAAPAAMLAIGAAYHLAAGFTLWQGRAEKLAARVPLIALFGLHAAVHVVGTISFGFGADPGVLVPVGSAFGTIHFESMVFTIGIAAFFLTLTRERKELHSRRAAHTDGLTGIANRQSFMESAERMVTRARRSKEALAVVMFDLDHFKAINDGHGHSTGDQVIRQFVRVVRDAMRPTDLFGRIGGEEFALVLPGVDADIAFARADRIRIEFSRSSFATVNEAVLTATVSAGVASGNGPTIAALLAEADDALYRAKATGRNRVMKATVSDKGKPVLRVA